MRRDTPMMTMTEFAYTLEMQHRELQRMEAIIGWGKREMDRVMHSVAGSQVKFDQRSNLPFNL